VTVDAEDATELLESAEMFLVAIQSYLENKEITS